MLGCASERSGDGQTLQGRREFALLKYRDLVTGVIPAGIRDRELAFAEQLPGSTAAVLAATKQSEDVQQYGAWTHRGPANIGGRTRAIAFDVANDATMLAGAVSGGVWKTTASGSTWKLTTRPFQLHSVTCLAQDVRQGKRNTWYYGTGEIYGNSSMCSLQRMLLMFERDHLPWLSNNGVPLHKGVTLRHAGYPHQPHAHP